MHIWSPKNPYIFQYEYTYWFWKIDTFHPFLKLLVEFGVTLERSPYSFSKSILVKLLVHSYFMQIYHSLKKTCKYVINISVRLWGDYNFLGIGINLFYGQWRFPHTVMPWLLFTLYMHLLQGFERNFEIHLYNTKFVVRQYKISCNDILSRKPCTKIQTFCIL